MRVSRRQLALIASVIAVAVVAAVVAIIYAGSGSDKVPEGGSSFSNGPRQQVQRVGLLDALAPLLSGADSSAQSATSGATPAGGRGGRSRTPRAIPKLPLDRAVAQLFAVGYEGAGVDVPFFQRLQVRDWGAVVLSRSNLPTRTALSQITQQIGAVARTADHVQPLVVAAPGLPGTAHRGPSSIAGAGKAAKSAARRLRRAGVTMGLAPNADIGYADGPDASFAFGNTAQVVSPRVLAAVNGYRAGGVAPVVGHFPGEGSASQDPDDGTATVGLGPDDLKASDLKPFDAVAKATPVVAMSDAVYAAYDGVTPATLLDQAVMQLRKTGFAGVVMSGNLSSATFATGEDVAGAAVDALRAGCDLLYVPGDSGDQEAAFRAVVRAVRSGSIPNSRFRDALARVSALKKTYKVTG